jgi:ElaB/YqjD/DUF883 family membrane-anchored ribosome-binding protein
MLESNIKLVNNDVKVLLKDAQVLFQSASALTGEKADEMRIRAMRVLETAQDRVQELQANALIAGKAMAVSADGYVKEKPWQAIAAAAGVGLLVGMVMGRK